MNAPAAAPIKLSEQLASRMNGQGLARRLRRRDRRRSPVRRRLARALLHRRLDLPGRAAGRRRAAQRATTRRWRSPSRARCGVPILPRGAGTTQCGQTVGAALVIDHSKYLNQVIDFDAAAMTVTVQPGIVLDHLNAWLKPHGLWFPVDVCTAAQARSAAWPATTPAARAPSPTATWCTTCRHRRHPGRRHRGALRGRAAPCADAPPRVRELVAGLRAIAAREHDEIERMVPKVMRRVGGYNLDIWHPQSERPYTAGRQRQPGAPAGRLRGHAGGHADASRSSCCRCPSTRRLASSTSPPSTRRWT